ncbi:hypothetical protein CDAR_257271 [Caerostris darwini]|uniref:Apoptotic chromatin condensation inducer in the nucleus n=1 Tax=Caerostris darwini TaxID=1538125 RepID=A0AAV4PMT4_9ARAC|nr:hypothetical protein CDAR_257271 [Caerostris darwini]
MEDEASILLDGKTLGNLRVVDLKQELEKRGLSKSGSKKDLVKRLKAQLEFEKLCGERKAGECDLKLDLDADTEKNEFVQQYLAQQQKIYAEQKAVKRLVELEETLKSSDEKESCDSAKEDEIPSVNEVLTELDKSNGNNSRENFSVQNSDTTSETLEETNGSESPQSPSTVPLPTEEPIEENGNHQRNQLILPEISPDVPSDPSIEIAECNNSIELQESQIVSPGIAVVPTDPMIEIFASNKIIDHQKDQINIENSKDTDHQEDQINSPEIIQSDHSNSSVTNTKCSDVVTSQEDQIVSSEFIRNVPDDSSVENTVDSSYQKVSFEMKDMLINSSVEINTDSSHQEVSSEMKDTHVDSSVEINTDSSHQEVSSEMKDTHVDSREIIHSQKPELLTEMEPSSQFSSVPYSLMDIQLPESPGNIVKSSKTTSDSIGNSQSNEDESVNSKNDDEGQSNGIESTDIKNSKSENSCSKKTERTRSCLDKDDIDMKNTSISPSRGNSEKSSVKTRHAKESHIEESRIVSRSQSRKKESGHKSSKYKDDSDDQIAISSAKESKSRQKVSGRKARKSKDDSPDQRYSRSRSREKDMRTHRVKEDSRHQRVSRSKSKDRDRKTRKSEKDLEDSKLISHRESRSGSRESDRKTRKSTMHSKNRKTVRRRLKSRSNSQDSRNQSSDSDKDYLKRKKENRERSPIPKKSKINFDEPMDSKSDMLPIKAVTSEKDEKNHGEDKTNITTVKKQVLEVCEVTDRKEFRSGSQESDRKIHKSRSHSSDSRSSQSSDSDKEYLKKKVKEVKRKRSSKERSPVLKRCKNSSDEDVEPIDSSTYDVLPTETISEKDKNSDSVKNSIIKMEEVSKTREVIGDKESGSVSRGRDSKVHKSRSHSLDSRSSQSSDSGKEYLEKKEGRQRSPISKRSKKNFDELSTEPVESTKSEVLLGTSQKDEKIDDSVKTTITVVKKEPIRQKLKIKRDNIVIPKSIHVEKDASVKSELPKESNIEEPDIPQPIKSAEENKEEFSSAAVEVPYVSRKIILSSRSQSQTSEDERRSKKSKWGSFASSQKTTQNINISTNSLKNWFPDFKLLKEPMPEEPASFTKEESEVELPIAKSNEDSKQVSSAKKVEEPIREVLLEENSEDASSASKILFIRNLVRPFTLNQLKELLRETGNFIEEEFWIDKIKSKCFVTYENEEEAIKTRKHLHGTRWPSSNPKILSVEFSNEEELAIHRSGTDSPKLVAQHISESAETEELRGSPTTDHKKSHDHERRRDRSKPLHPIREWDKDKISQESPDRASKEVDKHRSADKKEKKDSKRRANEDTPAKLLDDLFQKTKAAPCIYWLPLTDEQFQERAESRRLRRLEREKRNQQRELEDTENKNKRPRSRNRAKETEIKRSSTRSRSPINRRR